jgi:hypothetical protein
MPYQQQWVIGEVKNILEEYLNIEYHLNQNKTESEWIPRDDERLAPFQTMTLLWFDTATLTHVRQEQAQILANQQ